MYYLVLCIVEQKKKRPKKREALRYKTCIQIQPKEHGFSESPVGHRAWLSVLSLGSFFSSFLFALLIY
jgi:hypothetical protein